MDLTPFWIGIAVSAVIFGPLCARVATEKGRNPTTWGALGILLGVIALIALAAVPAIDDRA